MFWGFSLKIEGKSFIFEANWEDLRKVREDTFWLLVIRY